MRTNGTRSFLSVGKSPKSVEPEMVEAVHRADFDAAGIVVARQLERHDGAGAALRPDLAVEGGERADRLAVPRDDRVSGAHARLLGRRARRHPGDDERAADLVRGDPEPGASRAGHPPGGEK